MAEVLSTEFYEISEMERDLEYFEAINPKLEVLKTHDVDVSEIIATKARLISDIKNLGEDLLVEFHVGFEDPKLKESLSVLKRNVAVERAKIDDLVSSFRAFWIFFWNHAELSKKIHESK